MFNTGTLKKPSNNIFLENLKTTLHSLRNKQELTKICLLAGDFNYDILKYEHNPVINEFLNLMYSFLSTIFCRTSKSGTK